MTHFLQDDLCAVALFSCLCSVLCNFLPNDLLLKNYPRSRMLYLFVIDFIACCALRIRVDQPSLDKEFMGFKRKLRHAWRNWQQERKDQQENNS